MEPILIAYIGIAFMLTLSFIGSSYGVTVCGQATVGSMKKNPGSLGSYIILSALPSTQGIYAFIAYFMLKGFLVPEIALFTAIAIFASCLMLGISGLYASYRQANVCANGIVAVGSGHNVMVATMIMAAFPEFYAILALLVTILIGTAL